MPTFCSEFMPTRDRFPLSDAFGHDVDMLVEIVAQTVQQFVDGDRQVLQVPVAAG